MKKAVSICILLFACQSDSRIAVLEKRVDALEARRTPQPAPQQPTFVTIPLHDDDVSRGKGKIVIVEAFDFACPYCATSSKALDALIDRHADEVRVVSKQFVVHPDTATLPALAVCAAQKQGKGALFEHEVWATAWPSMRFDAQRTKADALDGIAKSLKLDVGRFQKDRDGAECKAQIERDQREMAAIGVRGTPAFYINGKPYNGPRTLEGFEAALRM